MIQFVEKIYKLDHLQPVCRILQIGALQIGPNSIIREPGRNNLDRHMAGNMKPPCLELIESINCASDMSPFPLVPRPPLRAAYVPILLTEGEGAFTVYDPPVWNQFVENQFVESSLQKSEVQFVEFFYRLDSTKWYSTNWLGPLCKIPICRRSVCRILELKKNDKTNNVGTIQSIKRASDRSQIPLVPLGILGPLFSHLAKRGRTGAKT